MVKYLFPSFYTFKFKLTITVLLLIISFLLSAIYFWYSSILDYAEKTSEEYVNEILAVSSRYFDNSIKELIHTMERVAINNDIINYTSSDRINKNTLLFYRRYAENYINSLLDYYRNYNLGAYIYCWDGEWIQTGSPLSIKKIISYKMEIDNILSSDNSVIIPPRLINNGLQSNEDKTDRYVLSVAKKIKKNGKSTGLITVDIDAKMIVSQFYSNLEGIGTVLLFDDKKNVVFEEMVKGINKNFENSFFTELVENFTNQSGSFYITVDNEKYFTIYRYSDYTKWISVALIPYEKLIEKSYANRNKLILIAVIICILAMAATILTSNILTRNIGLLHKAVSMVDKDNLEISVDIKSKDEIGLLFVQFKNLILRIKVLISDIKATEREKKRAEIEILQSQINPHFLYNTLNTIKFLAEMNGAKNIIKVSDSLSSLLHINMDRDKRFITISEEIEYIKNYVSIQEYKYINSFSIMYNINDDAADLFVLKLILQPIVENSIKYGILSLNRYGIIAIKAYIEDNCLKLTVEDNGRGINREKLGNILEKPLSEDIGIYNVYKRIKMHFGDPYGMKIFSEEDFYTHVEITIPVIRQQEVEKYV